MEATEKEAEKKRQRKCRNLESLNGRLAELTTEMEALEGTLGSWSEVLSKMVGSEHNGNAKPPTMSWRQYFEQAIGKKIENAPVNFNAHEMSFEEALILLSTHIGLLRKDLEKTKKLVAHQKERVAKSKVVSKRAEDRRKRKVEKTFDSIHNEEKQEEERPGCANKRGTYQNQKCSLFRHLQ